MINLKIAPGIYRHWLVNQLTPTFAIELKNNKRKMQENDFVLLGLLSDFLNNSKKLNLTDRNIYSLR
jgi:hypothetical protein